MRCLLLLPALVLLSGACSAPQETTEADRQAEPALTDVSRQAQTAPPTPVTPRTLATERPTVATHGLFRAIMVFVQFRDDRSTSDCSRGLIEWPLGELKPRLADYILASDPTPPFPDSSLTDFFYKQSNGVYTLYGDVFGYITRHNEAEYALRQGQSLDRGKLTREIIEFLAPQIDFRDYDANGDGFVDHIFVVLRNTRDLFVFHSGQVSGVSSLGGRIDDLDDLLDGVRIDPTRSGSYNRYGRVDVTRENVLLLAHEFGHDLFNGNRYFGNHLDPIIGNMMPYHPPEGETRSFADRMTGYTLMQGAGRASERIWRGHLTAAERSYVNADHTDDSLRWIRCHQPVHGATYALRDGYEFGDCFRIAFEEDEQLTELFIQHSDGHGVFTSPRYFPSVIEAACGGCLQVEGGLPVHGLMIELSQRQTELPFRAVRDILPADNRLTRQRGCDLATTIGPRLSETFADDFWRPDNRRQLTPWTRPNVFGYTYGHDVPNHYFDTGWHVVDNFRYTSSEGTQRPSIAFDYYQEPFSMDRFTISEDSWMGAESEGLSFSGLVRVANGATLTIESGVTVHFRGGLSAESGSRIVLGEGARAVDARGRPIDVR